LVNLKNLKNFSLSLSLSLFLFFSISIFFLSSKQQKRVQFQMYNRFKSGFWEGYYVTNGKKMAVKLDLQFRTDLQIDGRATMDIGYFQVKGTYENKKPYPCSLFFHLALSDQEPQYKFEGWRESEKGGICGNWCLGTTETFLSKKRSDRADNDTNNYTLTDTTTDASAQRGSFVFTPSDTPNLFIEHPSVQTESIGADSIVSELEKMGFPTMLCIQAAQNSKSSSLSDAVDWITESSFQKQENLKQLTNMGFTTEQATFALECCKDNLAEALDFLVQ